MLKYTNKINDISNCPGLHCEEKIIDAYRFVFDNMSGNSFIPVAVQSPNRFVDKSHESKCAGYALSMFTEENLAKKHLEKLMLRTPNIKKSIGNNLAFGIINEQYGLCTKINKSGHFGMFEYTNCNLKNAFEIIKSNL